MGASATAKQGSNPMLSRLTSYIYIYMYIYIYIYYVLLHILYGLRGLQKPKKPKVSRFSASLRLRAVREQNSTKECIMCRMLSERWVIFSIYIYTHLLQIK